MGELLVEAGLVTAAQVDDALRRQAQHGGKTVENLMALGYIDAATFVNFLARQPGVASVDLKNYEIPASVVSLVPREFALQREVFPIDRIGKLLTLGMVCPLDRAAIQELEDRTGLRVKPILCSASDIRQAIRRYYPSDDADHAVDPSAAGPEGLGSAVKLTGVATLIRKVSGLPVLPETVRRVRDVMSDRNTSVRDVAGIITLDPALAAKVLAVANSAAYGFPSKVDNLTLAVSLLGLREAYTIVLSASVLNVFEKSKALDYKRFWVESMCCAAASRLVAKASARRDLTGVFAAGLLHDIGRAVLAEVVGARYATIDQALQGLDLVAREEEVLGVGHPEAGYELANHWGLPPDIADAIRFHHRFERATDGRDFIAIVVLADVMVRAAGAEHTENKHLFDGCRDALQTLGLDGEAVEAMLQEYLAHRDTTLADALA